MTTTSLNGPGIQMNTGKESIVIKRYFDGIEGGRSLNVAGFPLKVIQAGHVIIKETSSGDYKPMPVVGAGTIETLGKLVGGSGYSGAGTYTGVALSGGSGSGAVATIVVAGGAVTTVTITNKGTGYKPGDTLSALASAIGGAGSGFLIGIAATAGTPTAYGTLPSGHTYEGILVASVLTDKAMAAIMTDGTANPLATPFSMTAILSDFKTAVQKIAWRAD